MKLLTLPTSEYLLKMGIEELHKQSIEWISQILFWNDEVDFFYRVIDRNKKGIVPVKVQNGIWHVEKELSKKNSVDLFELKNLIQIHEKNLNKVLKSDGKDEDSFRETHSEFASKIYNFNKNFTILKRSIFDLMIQIEICEASGNEITKNIFGRRSVRKYKDKPVAKAIIKKILEAGTMAPSASNKQPWKFYVLSNNETIHEFSREISKAAMRESSKSVVALFNFPYGDEQMMIQDMVFYHAPVVVFITSPRNDEWSDLDIGMCAQNMMLASRSYGLESCPVGFAKYVEQSDVYKKLNISSSEHVNLAVIFGYGNETPILHERKKSNIFFIE